MKMSLKLFVSHSSDKNCSSKIRKLEDYLLSHIVQTKNSFSDIMFIYISYFFIPHSSDKNSYRICLQQIVSYTFYPHSSDKNWVPKKEIKVREENRLFIPHSSDKNLKSPNKKTLMIMLFYPHSSDKNET